MEKTMEIILSTRNPSKASQIKALFEGSPITVLTLADAGIDGQGDEDGSTLIENAMAKAVFAHRPGKWAMADDTGLFIDALLGEPGVQAAYWAGKSATTDETTAHALKQLEGINNRSATFQTVVATISPDGKQECFTGSVRGKLLDAPRTKPQPNMPYSPLFVPDGSQKSWAEMTIEEENAISHRGIAFRAAREYLLTQLK